MGSGVLEATISAAPERLGGAVLGEAKERVLFGYFAEIRLRACSGGFLPSARFVRFGRMALRHDDDGLAGDRVELAHLVAGAAPDALALVEVVRL